MPVRFYRCKWQVWASLIFVYAILCPDMCARMSTHVCAHVHMCAYMRVRAAMALPTAAPIAITIAIALSNKMESVVISLNSN